MCSLTQFTKFVGCWKQLEKEFSFSSTTYMQIFLLVAEYPNMTTGELTEKVDTSQPTMYRALNSFYKAGLGRKVQSMEDPRMFNFQLTPKGKELVKIIKGEKIHK